MGFRANGGFDFTKELKEMLRKKRGFRANGGFALQRKRENSYEKKGVWSQRWIWLCGSFWAG